MWSLIGPPPKKKESVLNADKIEKVPATLLTDYHGGLEEKEVFITIVPTRWACSKELSIEGPDGFKLTFLLSTALKYKVVEGGFTFLHKNVPYTLELIQGDQPAVDLGLCRAIFSNWHKDSNHGKADDEILRFVHNFVSKPVPIPIDSLVYMLNCAKQVEGEVELTIMGDIYKFQPKEEAFLLINNNVKCVISNVYPDSKSNFRRILYIIRNEEIALSTVISVAINPVFGQEHEGNVPLSWIQGGGVTLLFLHKHTEKFYDLVFRALHESKKEKRNVLKSQIGKGCSTQLQSQILSNQTSHFATHQDILSSNIMFPRTSSHNSPWLDTST